MQARLQWKTTRRWGLRAVEAVELSLVFLADAIGDDRGGSACEESGSRPALGDVNPRAAAVRGR